MKIVRMDGHYDCGAAVLATVLGLKTTRAVYPMLGYDPNDADKDGYGTCEEELTGVLTTCGLRYTRWASLEYLSASVDMTVEAMCRRVKLPTERELHCKLELHKGTSIVSVPKFGSATYTPGHWLVVHSGTVYDPANGSGRYIGAAKSLPICTVLLIDLPKAVRKSARVPSEDEAVESDWAGGLRVN
jgi:hypothetical protein